MLYMFVYAIKYENAAFRFTKDLKSRFPGTNVLKEVFV